MFMLGSQPRWALGRIWHSFGFRIVVKPHAGLFFPGVDAIKRLADQQRLPEGRMAGKARSGCWKNTFSVSQESPLPLYRASGAGSFVNQSVSCHGTTRLETHIRRVIKNTFPLFVSNVNSVLGWELFPGLKITTVNINVMLPRSTFLLSVHMVIMAGVIALNLPALGVIVVHQVL